MLGRAGHQHAGHLLGVVALAGALLVSALSPEPVRAQDALPTEPLLRIASDRHTAAVNHVAVDAQNRYVVTTSDDKTARVWSLPDAQLLSVLRVPIDHGHI